MNFKTWLLENHSTIDDVVQQLPKFYKNQVPEMFMTNIIYDYLTTHAERDKTISDLLTNDMAKYQEYNQAYKKIIQILSQKLPGIGWTPVDNGAWIEWYRKGKSKASIKSDNMTSKRYISVNPKDVWTILQSLPILAKALDKVQTSPESDVIGFKIPLNFGAFYKHKDNIVIHFYDANAKDQIDQAVKEFFQKIGTNEFDRSQYNRQNFGRDKDTSDSMLVARQVVHNLKLNQNAFQDRMNNPQMLKNDLESLIHNISANASHRNVH